MLGELPGMDTGARTAIVEILMLLVSMCALRERYGLTAQMGAQNPNVCEFRANHRASGGYGCREPVPTISAIRAWRKISTEILKRSLAAVGRARRRGRLQARHMRRHNQSKVMPLAGTADKPNAPRVWCGSWPGGDGRHALRGYNSLTARECRGQRARRKGAADPRGKKEAKDRLLPGCLRLLGFAGPLLAVCLFLPCSLMQEAKAKSPGQSVSQPTVPIANAARGPAADAGSPNGTSALPVLTTARAVHSLSHAQSQLHYPVQFATSCRLVRCNQHRAP